LAVVLVFSLRESPPIPFEAIPLHEITVSGLTITSADFHPSRSFLRTNPKQSVSAMTVWSLQHRVLKQPTADAGGFSRRLFLTTDTENDRNRRW